MGEQVTYRQISEMLAHFNMTEKKINIIVSAIHLFLEKGYAATSTREIAARADVAEATIFKHYTTKKELFVYISEHVLVNALSRGFSTVLGHSYSSLRDFLTALFDNRWMVFEENISLIRLLLQEAPFHYEIKEMIINKISTLPLLSCIQQLKAKKLVVDKPDGEIASFLFSSVIGFFGVRYILLEELYKGSRAEDMFSYIDFLEHALKPVQTS